ncbi:MAG TPA: hypothetical protein VFO83_02190 [Aggregicoccus sp.]|nr:hypothetical protein [Aggregicoccus sp.]
MNESERRHAMKQRLEHLKTLRDEIRLDLHLAGMEARTRWEDLEPMTRDAQLLSGEVSELAHERLEQLLERLRAFREDLRYGTQTPPSRPR